MLPLRPCLKQELSARQPLSLAFWGLAAPFPLPLPPCLHPDAPRLGITSRGLEEPSGQHTRVSAMSSSRSFGQCCCAPCLGRKASICGPQGSSAKAGSVREGAQPCLSPKTRAWALSHSACAMLGSQLHALLQTPWDLCPGRLLQCCMLFLLAVNPTDGTAQNHPGRKKRADLPSPLYPPGDSRVGLIQVWEAQPYRGPASLLPSPMVRGRELSSVSPGQQQEGGVRKHTGYSHPIPSSLSRLFSTQRPQGTGGQSIYKNPLPEGGPWMYCLPRLIVNTVPEDSSVGILGAETPPPASFPAGSGLTSPYSQRQNRSSSNQLI